MKFTFLSDKFYEDHPHDKYNQLEMKESRPYTHIELELYDAKFAVPLRSNIDHPHAFFTNKEEKCGVDFSKVVVVTDPEYIDCTRKAFIRPDEYIKLKGKEYRLKKMLTDYIDLYKKAKSDDKIPHRDKILNYSTLQYFEDYINI
ncbi:MAG: hypothetical protein E7251_10260 [Paenibacillaceae bacterium]|nr:hypothetical protein [Paenibacillaceae bacterium]